MSPSSLNDWLDYIERLHPLSIDLGLDRVRRVARAMDLPAPSCPVITVAGTNGKGSSVAMLDAILSTAGYRTAVYTSPHLLRYNERVRIAGLEADDEALCRAFEQVEHARGGQTLTYFEFGTLAALDLFARADSDVMILEVGMGGRLDAVNIVNADIALITAIGLDHTDWLGVDRDTIGREKAGICRAGRPAVCSDPHPPCGLLAAVSAIGATLYRSGDHFSWMLDSAADSWTWEGPRRSFRLLPRPALAGRFQLQNAAGALMVLELLSGRLDAPEEAIRRGLADVSVPGRFQSLDGPITRVLDVAHNVDGALALAETLAARPVAGATRAVVAILADKDIAGMVSALKGVIDEWHVGALPVARAAEPGRLLEAIADRACGAPAHGYPDVPGAYRGAFAHASPGDRIVVFGSFYTVAGVMRLERGAASAA